MKKSKLLLTLFAATVCLTACGGNGTQTTTDTTVETEAQTEDASAETDEATDTEETEETADTDVSDENTLIVGTFNIDAKSAPDVAAQSKLMADNNVEVVGIQEVDNNTIRNPRNMLEEFMIDPYIDSYYTNAIGFQGGEYGIGTVSQYKLIDTSETKLFSDEFKGKELADELAKAYMNNDPDDQASCDALDAVSEKGPVEPRYYQRVVFEKDGKQVAFYNTHLSYEDLSLRAQQLETLKEALDNDTCEYLILVGDFNADQGTNEFDVFKEDYKLSNGKDGVWLDTYTLEDDTMKVKSIDNIIVSKNIDIESVKMVANSLSDHNPLVAELVLN